MNFYITLLIAIALIAAEIFAAKKNKRISLLGSCSSLWEKTYRWRWALGVPLGIASAFIHYPMAGKTETYKVIVYRDSYHLTLPPLAG
jgi:hypothetical protein